MGSSPYDRIRIRKVFWIKYGRCIKYGKSCCIIRHWSIFILKDDSSFLFWVNQFCKKFKTDLILHFEGSPYSGDEIVVQYSHSRFYKKIQIEGPVLKFLDFLKLLIKFEYSEFLSNSLIFFLLCFILIKKKKWTSVHER
mgnify:CR=1 FL=1